LQTFAKSLTHAYLLTLGEFDYDDDRQLIKGYYVGIGALIFLIATFVNLIVMLNLLVAIFSKVHDDFQERKHEQSAFQYVQIIHMTYQILDWFTWCRKKNTDMFKLLMFAKEIKPKIVVFDLFDNPTIADSKYDILKREKEEETAEF